MSSARSHGYRTEELEDEARRRLVARVLELAQAQDAPLESPELDLLVSRLDLGATRGGMQAMVAELMDFIRRRTEGV